MIESDDIIMRAGLLNKRTKEPSPTKRTDKPPSLQQRVYATLGFIVNHKLIS